MVSIIQFLIPKQREKNFLSTAIKTISACIYVLRENLYCCCMYTKTESDKSWLFKKLCEW